MQKKLQILEHQTIRIGDCQKDVVFEEKHFQELAQYSEQHNSKYFKVVYRGIRFSNYVGVIQVGDLLIEILPKTEDETTDFKVWQGVLIDMLRVCKLLKLETISSASLSLKQHSILEIYFELFLTEVEKLMQEGLVKTYHRKEENLPVLKGRLVVPKHLRKNLNNRDRFLVNFEKYDFNHPLNQIILSGLNILKKQNLNLQLSERLQKIKAKFPKISSKKITQNDFEIINLHRQTTRYQNALEIARLLIFNFHPDIRGGKNHVLALLFDMNLLWEEFIYRQLKALQNEDFLVRRQVQKPFWKRRYLKPDIVVTYQGKNYVLDTKWKVPKSAQPSMEDLRQIYVYGDYFSAKKGILIYPKTKAFVKNIEFPFLNKNDTESNMTCKVTFVKVIENQKLSKKTGKELMNVLFS